jgi:hypothetical protein
MDRLAKERQYLPLPDLEMEDLSESSTPLVKYELLEKKVRNNTHWVLCIYLVTKDHLLVDFHNEGKIFSVKTFEEIYSIETNNEPIRCAMRFYDLLVCGLENASLRVFDVENQYNLT